MSMVQLSHIIFPKNVAFVVHVSQATAWLYHAPIELGSVQSPSSVHQAFFGPSCRDAVPLLVDTFPDTLLYLRQRTRPRPGLRIGGKYGSAVVSRPGWH